MKLEKITSDFTKIGKEDTLYDLHKNDLVNNVNH